MLYILTTSGYEEQVIECEKAYWENHKSQDKESVREQLKKPLKKTGDYQKQKTVKRKEQEAR